MFKMDGNPHQHNGHPGQHSADGVKTSSGEDRGKGKGKAKDESLTGRIYESAKLAANSLSGGQPPVATPGEGKATGQSSLSDAARVQNMSQETSSYRIQQSALHGTIRSSASGSGETSDAFESFLDPQQLPLADAAIAGPGPSSLERQRQEDGSDVVNLLSMPDDDVDLGLDDDGLSPDEAERLRAALFSSQAQAPRSRWDTLLDFVPSFISRPEDSSERLQYTGTRDPVAARDTWLQQWDDVLSSYTDEVWGDLGPLVTAARAEVDELAHETSSGLPGGETKALDRLRLILAHVRGH